MSAIFDLYLAHRGRAAQLDQGVGAAAVRVPRGRAGLARREARFDDLPRVALALAVAAL